jgi:hypothetical protein
MKIFTESEVVGGRGRKRSNVSAGDLIRLNDGREVIKTRHSMRDQEMPCVRNSGERCVFIDDPLCGSVRCASAIYLEKPVYLQLKLVGDVE